MRKAAQPFTLLISAMGGEGGGVLADWITKAASMAGFPVSRTSVPGVAQRTGATTYYIEIWPEPLGSDDPFPVFALQPTPGGVDVLAVTELLEIGRALKRGYCTPDRTTLIASTHRVFAIHEKMALGDGRVDGHKLLKAAGNLAHTCLLFDLDATARSSGGHFNATMLGAIAGSGKLPIPLEAFIAAIEAEGKAVGANLAGFEAGVALAAAPPHRDKAVADGASVRRSAIGDAAVIHRTVVNLPDAVRSIAQTGIERLCHYQGRRYAALYLDRLAGLIERDRPPFTVSAEVARQLALLMSYEDVIRVAQLKTARNRFDRIRAEVRAPAGAPVDVIDFLKPGLTEICSVLPPRIAARLLRLAERRPTLKGLAFPMRVRTSSVTGFLCLRLLAAFRPWRPYTYQFARTQEMIDRWLGLIRDAFAVEGDLALEVAACGALVKGYGDTHARSLGKFDRILDEVVRPALAGEISPRTAAEAVLQCRLAALAEEADTRLSAVIAAVPRSRGDTTRADR